MSKRKERGGQRLNRELLDRAREQAQDIENEAAEAEELTTPVAPIQTSARPSAAPRSTASRLRARNQEARKRSLTGEEVSQMLSNPTKIVSEAELRAQYGFVLADLRSMGLLAVASFAVLVVLAFVLPK